MLIIKKVKLERVKEHKTRTDLIFSTKESLDPIEVEQLLKSFGYLAFNSDQFKKKVEELINDKRLGVSYDQKTKSQRLRGVLSEIAIQNSWDAEEFYANEMDKICKHYRDKYLNR